MRELDPLYWFGPHKNTFGRSLDAIVRKFLGMLSRRMGVTGQLFAVNHHRLPDGTLIKLVIDKRQVRARHIVDVFVPELADEPLVQVPDLYAVWMPTGFILTPRTATAEFGYGLPRHNWYRTEVSPGVWEFERIDPSSPGTINGPFPSCLVNKYRYNRYPEHANPEALFSADAPLLLSSPTGMVPVGAIDCNEQLALDEEYQALIADWDATFKVRANQWESKSYLRYASPEQEDPTQWFAHFYEEKLYYDNLRADMFEYLNAERTAGNECMFPYVGFVHGSQLICELAREHKLLSHTHTIYGAENESAFQRNRKNRERPHISAPGEILLASTPVSGAEAVDLWMSSPEHQPIIVDDRYDYKRAGLGSGSDYPMAYCGVVDVGVAGGATIERSGLSESEGIQDEIPPVNGNVYAAVFDLGSWGTNGTAGHNWIGYLGTVSHGNNMELNNAGRVRPYDSTRDEDISKDYGITISINGRSHGIRLAWETYEGEDDKLQILGAALRLDDIDEWPDQDRIEYDIFYETPPDKVYDPATDTRKVPVLLVAVYAVPDKNAPTANSRAEIRFYTRPLNRYDVWIADPDRKGRSIDPEYVLRGPQDWRLEYTILHTSQAKKEDFCAKVFAASNVDFSAAADKLVVSVRQPLSSSEHDECFPVVQRSGNYFSNYGNFFEIEREPFLYRPRRAAVDTWYEWRKGWTFHSKREPTPLSAFSDFITTGLPPTIQFLYRYACSGIQEISRGFKHDFSYPIQITVDDEVNVAHGVTLYPNISPPFNAFKKIYLESLYEYTFDRSLNFASGKEFQYCYVNQQHPNRTPGSFYCFFTELDYQTESFTVLRINMERSDFHPDSFLSVDHEQLGVTPEQAESYRQMFWCVWGTYEILVYDDDNLDGISIWKSDECIVEVVDMFPYINVLDGYTAQEKVDAWTNIVPRFPMDIIPLMSPQIRMPVVEGFDPHYEWDNWFPDWMPSSYLAWDTYFYGFNPLLGINASINDIAVSLLEDCGETNSNDGQELYSFYELPLGPAVPVPVTWQHAHAEEVTSDGSEFYYRTFSSPGPRTFQQYRKDYIYDTIGFTDYFRLEQKHDIQTVRYKGEWVCCAEVARIGVIEFGGQSYSYNYLSGQYSTAYYIEQEEQHFFDSSEGIDLESLVNYGETLYKNVKPMSVVDYKLQFLDQ